MVNSFEMLSAEQAIRKIKENKEGLDAGAIQIDEINLSILSELTRWNMDFSQRQKFLKNKKPELILKTMFFGLTAEAWKNLTEADWELEYRGFDYQLIFPVHVKDENVCQGEIITPQAVLRQVHYLLQEPIDLEKEALDFCLLSTLKNLRFRISPKIPIYVYYFPNLLTPAFSKLQELGWEVMVMDDETGIELRFPSDLIKTF